MFHLSSVSQGVANEFNHILTRTVRANFGERRGEGVWRKSTHPRSQNSGKSAQVYKWQSYTHNLLLNFNQKELFDANGVFNARVTARNQPQHPRDPTQDFLIDFMQLNLLFRLPSPSVTPPPPV